MVHVLSIIAAVALADPASQDQRIDSLAAATAAMDEDRYEQAIEILTNLCDENPDQAEYRVLLGRAHFRSGDPEMAKRCAAEVLQRFPTNEGALLLIAHIYAKNKQWDQVLETLLPLSGSGGYEAMHLLAQAYDVENDPDQACWYYQLAVRKNPKAVDDWLTLGKLHVRREAPALAIRALETVLELGRETAEVHELLARAYLRAGRPMERTTTEYIPGAIENKTHRDWFVLESVPEKPHHYLVCGTHCALFHAQKARELGYDSPEVRLLLADIWLRADRHAQAAAVYASLEGSLPEEDRAGYHYRYGLALYHLQDLPGFEEHLLKALELNPQAVKPNLLDAYLKLADGYCLQGALEKTVHYLERAITVNPEDVSLHYRLGNTLLEADRDEEAAIQYRIVLQMDPHHPDQKRMLEMLNE